MQLVSRKNSGQKHYKIGITEEDDIKKYITLSIAVYSRSVTKI